MFEEKIMVESKLTKVKVNNEIELCEVYDNTTKERIKKVFFREGISFFIKFRKKFQMVGLAAVDLAGEEVSGERTMFPETKEGRYIICVNQSQEELARRSIMRVVPDHGDRVRFFSDDQKEKDDKIPFWEMITQSI